MEIMATSIEPPPSHITTTTIYTYTDVQLPPQTTHHHTVQVARVQVEYLR